MVGFCCSPLISDLNQYHQFLMNDLVEERKDNLSRELKRINGSAKDRLRRTERKQSAFNGETGKQTPNLSIHQRCRRKAVRVNKDFTLKASRAL